MSLTNQQYNEFCDELTTIQDILRWTVTQFEHHDLYFGHGTDNSWDEALTLLVYFLALDSDNLSHVLNAKLTTSEKQEYFCLLEKRINEKMPLPYITNQAWFAGMAFYVDERVLIPRSPMAELIQQNFQPWLNLEPFSSSSIETLNVLEIGTGSACIACALAYHFLQQDINISVDASDISDAALEVAQQNRAAYSLDDTVNLVKSDLFENLDNKTYDLIISNPPYVDSQEMGSLPAEFLHEPRGALAAGDDGLDLVSIILSQAALHLNDYGILIVEVGASQPALMTKYPNLAFTWLDFAHGGQGVFLLTKQQLVNYNFDK